MLIGFLRYNFNPATIFLGDSGSLFVGFMLGSLELAAWPSARSARSRSSSRRGLSHIRAVLETTFLDNEFDGYELEYVPASVAGIAPEIRMAWCKPEAIGILGKPDVWHMDLPLGGEARNRGNFRVYRQYSDKPLMLDINLLTRFFPGELSKALDRATHEELAAAKALSAAAAVGATPLSPFQSSA